MKLQITKRQPHCIADMQGCRFSGNTAKSGPSLCTRLSATDVAGDNVSLDPADIEYMDH